MNIFDQLDELERDVDLALDEERDRAGFAGSGFHEECGMAWRIHNNRNKGWKSPFGCPPSETEAREAWGR